MENWSRRADTAWSVKAMKRMDLRDMNVDQLVEWFTRKAWSNRKEWLEARKDSTAATRPTSLVATGQSTAGPLQAKGRKVWRLAANRGCVCFGYRTMQ